MSTQLATPTVKGGPFSDTQAFELSMRMAQVFYTSDMVPESYRGQQKCGNVIIALDIAHRLGASPLMVMQNLYIVHGVPSWSSKFLIACFNGCKRFTSINYETNVGVESDKSKWFCIAKSTILATGEVIESDKITWQMVEAEGWARKNGSKWLTMPGQMFRYRAAAFLIRTHAPELSFGFYTQEETLDIEAVEMPDNEPEGVVYLPEPAEVNDAIAEINASTTLAELKAAWASHRQLQAVEAFKQAKDLKKQELTTNQE